MAKVANKAVLIVIDGWGIHPEKNAKGDAVAAAETPVMDAFRENAAGYTELEASSLAVGLPEGLMGNSEVGHLNIGAGRVVWQDVVRIDLALSKGKFPEVENIKASFSHAQNTTKRLHLLGLISDGGVHSHQNHLYGLLQTVKDHYDIPEVYIHFFGDGRDTDPKSGARYMKELQEKIKEIGVGKVATVVGRYYAMDRDKRWQRVEVALDGLVNGKGEEVEEDKLVDAIQRRYEQGETDEFLKPIIANGDAGRIKDGDTLFFFNYRSDRVREITQLLGVDSSPLPDFKFPKNLHITTMTQYKIEYPFPIAFPPQRMDDVLAEWLSEQGLKQCHVAETEKYAHVTFFFNGGVELQFDGEHRDMVASPRVATYDLQPEMSAMDVAEKLAERIAEGKYEFLMNNFAPPDMVGHTGIYEAAVKAVAATDKAIGRIYEACKEHGYILFVTADHGNAEEMINEEGKPKTAHTTNKVPFVMANAPKGFSLTRQGEPGVLGDVAPTVLAAMGLPQPEHMTGRSLLVKGGVYAAA
ncbi:2,3-bisphosphoglycerate-independent phosphoglycerate mutase [Kalaharituber pfeilii]|nr:2,3-bisphosphoglycerate-independent phosphoglycerate mutase [Kalaharituber pfeilii]